MRAELISTTVTVRIEELEQAPGEEKKIEGEGEIDRGGCKEALRRAN